MTACTPKEEAEWRSRLDRPDAINSFETTEAPTYSSIFLDIRSLGAVFGKPGKFLPLCL